MGRELGLEYLTKLPFLDVIFSGPSDWSFPTFVSVLSGGHDIERAADNAARLGDLTFRGKGGKIYQHFSNTVTPMKNIPVPDFTDYELVWGSVTSCPLQFSRGCGYGSSGKGPCFFCCEPGLNKHQYGAKSYRDAFLYLDEAVKRCPEAKLFNFCDALLPANYVEKVLKPWHEKHNDIDIRIFTELQPHISNKSLKMLVEAGVKDSQIGIETLDPRVLPLMNKDHQPCDSINCLRWAQYYGMSYAWNYLIQVPGEKPEWVPHQLDLVRNAMHLPGPTSVTGIKVTRHSYYLDHQEEFGIYNVRPSKLYEFILPDYIDRSRVCWSFDYDHKNGWNPLVADLLNLAVRWRRMWHKEEWHDDKPNEEPPRLEFCRGIILDTRFEKECEHQISELSESILSYCSEPRPVSYVVDRFGKDAPRLLEELDSKALVFVHDDIYISYVKLRDEDVKSCYGDGLLRAMLQPG